MNNQNDGLNLDNLQDRNKICKFNIFNYFKLAPRVNNENIQRFITLITDQLESHGQNGNNDSIKMCEEHDGNQAANRYCKACKKVLCSDCALDNEHYGHNEPKSIIKLVDLPSIVKEEFILLKEDIKKKKEELYIFNNSGDDSMKNLENEYRNKEKTLEILIGKINNCIDYFKKMKVQLSKTVNKSNDEVDKNINKCKISIIKFI
jgi:hypothetical protein